MSGDAFLHGFTRHQGLAFVFLKVVLAVAASAALYGLLQDGERSKPSVVQSMQLGGLLTLNLLLQLVAITDLAWTVTPPCKNLGLLLLARTSH